MSRFAQKRLLLKATNFAQYFFLLCHRLCWTSFHWDELYETFLAQTWCSQGAMASLSPMSGSAVLVQVHCQRYNLGETPPLISIQPHSIYPVSFHHIVLAILYSGIVGCMLSVRAHVLDCLVMKKRVRERRGGGVGWECV